MLDNKTKLQEQILESIKGYSHAEVVHAFEVIKLDFLVNNPQ